MHKLRLRPVRMRMYIPDLQATTQKRGATRSALDLAEETSAWAVRDFLQDKGVRRYGSYQAWREQQGTWARSPSAYA